MLTAVADPEAPAPVTDVSVLTSLGAAYIQWNAPDSANFQAVAIRRGTTGAEGAAVLVRTEYGPVSNSDAWTDEGLATGTYYYWLRSRNASGVESASIPTGPVTIT